jgi:hypothetical protein
MEFEEEHQRRMAQEEAKKATDYSEITGASFNEHDSYRYSPHELVYAFDPKKGENRPTKQYDA